MSSSVDPDFTIDEGQRLIGEAHTHPYSFKEGGQKGIAFSADDISNIYDNIDKEGFFSMIEAGNTRFALVITDSKKAGTFFSENNLTQIKEAYDKAQGAAAKDGASFQDQIKAAVASVIGEDGKNGLRFYQTTDKKKLNFEEVKR